MCAGYWSRLAKRASPMSMRMRRSGGSRLAPGGHRSAGGPGKGLTHNADFVSVIPFTRVGSQAQSLSRPHRARDCDRRVAQWQSTPTTWERSGVRFPFAPTIPSMKSPYPPRVTDDTRPLAEAKFRPIWTKPCAIVNRFINIIPSISRCQTAIRWFSDFPAASCAPSVRPECREQGPGQKRLFGAE